MNSCKKLLWMQFTLRVCKFAAFLATCLILALRPILGPAICRYELTCTKFAAKCLAELPLHKAVWKIIKRLLACNPFFS